MSAALWPNGKTSTGDVWHEYGPRAPIWTPNGPTSSFHSGIDIGPWGDKGGTWLLSPVDGEVTHAGYDDIFGNRVVVSAEIDGDDVEFWLCHGRTGSMRVKRGDTVSQKQQLQLMGETGKASGVHVHFEVHVNSVRVDPRAFYARPAGAGSSISKTIQEDEMTASFINVQGKGGSHRAGVFAIMRDNSGKLFAKRMSFDKTDPSLQTLDNSQLSAWRQSMPFHELTE